MRIIVFSFYEINKETNIKNIIPEKFIWQRGFGVFGISHSAVENVYYYIRNQKQHHQKRTFESEYLKFMDLKMWNWMNNLIGMGLNT